MILTLEGMKASKLLHIGRFVLHVATNSWWKDFELYMTVRVMLNIQEFCCWDQKIKEEICPGIFLDRPVNVSSISCDERIA